MAASIEASRSSIGRFDDRRDPPEVGRPLLAAGEDGRPSGLKATNQTWFSWRNAGPIGLAGDLVPELGRAVVAAGEHGPAVAADGQGPERAVVPQGRRDGPAGRARPRAGRPVPSAGDHGAARRG